LPCALTGGYTLITGERIKSQYADFSKDEPNFDDITGEYVLADISKKQLNLPDSIAEKGIFRFNADSSFEFEYFPRHDFEAMELSQYKLINATGKWEMEKSRQGS
jgi:hypothetical protein